MLKCLTSVVSVLAELSLKTCCFMKMVVEVPMWLVEKSILSVKVQGLVLGF